ncbi:MAG: TatD family hydrolase [Flavobacteriales bacterium]|nr:TatD family hydrolase [Flavobacteriales bacterium]
MELIDTHCHLYDAAFDDDRAACVHRARQTGILAILLPNVDETTWQPMLDLASTDRNFFHWMAGLHPCSVPDDPTALAVRLDEVAAYLKKGGAAGVGEIGLDLHWRQDNLHLQKEAFVRQCRMALQWNLPVAVHSRSALEETLEVMTQPDLKGLRGVLHCFSGTTDQAARAVEHGFYLGVGGVLTFKNSGLDSVLRNVPRRWVVLETDAPYLAPAPHRGRRNEPSYLGLVVQKLAEVWNCPADEAARITSENARRLWRI